MRVTVMIGLPTGYITDSPLQYYPYLDPNTQQLATLTTQTKL